MRILRNELERRKGKKEQLTAQLLKEKKLLRKQRRQLKRAEQALEILREVGLCTQEELQYHIADLVTSAMEAVFPDPYEFSVEFMRKRNKTECVLRFARGEETFHPLLGSGGGAVDIAAFALRITSWSISRPATRNMLVLDEPFRFLSRDLLPKAGEMLKEISERLELQIIMVTHSRLLADQADRIFSVRKTGEISIVEGETI